MSITDEILDIINLSSSKSESKKLVKSLDIPVIEGYNGDEQNMNTLIKEAKIIGFPLLIKSKFGGGGKAMKIVNSLDELIQTKGVDLIKFFIGFSAFVAVAILVVAGYLFITSGGDPEKVEKAQKAITAAIVGLVIVFIARAIVFFVVDLGNL